MSRTVRTGKRRIFLSPLVKQGLAASLIVVLLFLVYYWRLPEIKDIKYSFNGQKINAWAFPVTRKNSGSGALQVSFSISIKPWQGKTLFQVQADDCIRKIRINQSVVFPPHCSYNSPRNIDLSRYLKTGTNTVSLTVRDVIKGTIGLDFSISPDEPVMKTTRFLAGAVMLLFLLSVFHQTIGKKRRLLTAAFGTGLLLRFLYVFVTPVGVRSHDWDAHVDYIKYLVTHLALPPTNAGWEYYQSPLYYLIVSPIYALGGKLHLPAFGLLWIQQVSLLFSALTLFTACWIGTLLFRRKNPAFDTFFFCLLIGCFSGLIFYSSRITNEVLYQLPAFVSFGLLIKWWHDEKIRTFLLLNAAIGVAVLTKSSAYLFIPILWMCILFRPQTTFRAKVHLILISGGLVAVLAGWFLLFHYLKNDFGGFLAFGGGWNTALNISITGQSFLTISPLLFPDTPFVNPWINAGGRQFFWVYFIKSALFGEFSFPTLAVVCRLLLELGLGMLILMFLGIVRTFRKDEEFFVPMFVTSLIMLLAAAFFPIYHPVGPSQDFRYSVLLLVPFSYFVIHAIRSKQEILEAAGLAWASFFILVSSVFIIGTFLVALSA